MTVVKINALTVPRERLGEFVQRFRDAGADVPSSGGFEGYELLVPDDERDTCLVITRWRSHEDFVAWTHSLDFTERHRRHRTADGPVATASKIWSFEIVD